jgi:hypothetical protein
MADENQAENVLTFALQDKADGAETSVSIDRARIPANIRLELLDRAIKQLVNGRPHQAAMKFAADTKEYKAKCDADPTFDGAAPTAPNLAELANNVISELYEGKLRQRGKGGAKQTEAKDPVDAVVTQAVIRELFQKRKAEKPGTKYQEVVKEVGTSGIAYLNARATSLANGDEKRLAELTKTIDSKYIKPARAMVSQNAKGEQVENELL